MSAFVDEAQMLWRFVRGLHRYLATPITLADAERLVDDDYRLRQRNFLLLMRRGVFERPKSPYKALFDWAGIELGDLEQLVEANGLEGALGRLYDAGVRVGLDEFKGRQPIRRNGLEIPTRAEDFDNPLLLREFELQTGGSTGARRRLAIDFAILEHDSAFKLVYYHANGIADRPLALWRPVPPGSSGLKNVLNAAKQRGPLQKWFSPTWFSWAPSMWPSAVFSACAFFGLRSAGLPYPLPEHVPLSEGHRVASWAAGKVAAGAPPCLDQPSSNAVRIATAALERGWDISGSRFRFGGEPMTPAKYARIREAGCEVVAGWALSEAGPLAGGCVQREYVDEVHLFEGKIAVIQRPVTTNAGVEHADVLHLTTLLPATPKILLNVDTGDTATISVRDCGCPLHRPSMRTRVHTIRNYEKLTTSGMHFTASEILSLVETVLPAKFGGDPTDYQFVEEHAQELSTVAIWIHPRIGPLKDETVVETALRALGADSRGNSMMASNWRQGHSLRVVRREPYVTPAAKTPPIRVISREDA